MTIFAAAALAGGFEVADQGAWAAGRAGAFTARADDLSAIYYNPAGLADVRGTRLYLTYRLAYTDMEYTRARTLDWSDATHGVPKLVDFEPVTLENPVFPYGLMFAVASDFGLKDFAFALGVFGPPAIGEAQFPPDGPQKYMLVEKNVLLLYYTASAAWKYKDVFGIGLSLQVAHVPSMSFEMVVDGNVAPRTVYPVDSPFDIDVLIKGGNLFNFTSTIGLWFRPVPFLEIAAASQFIPMDLEIPSRVYLKPLHLKLDKPIVVTKNGVPDNRVTFGMTLPANVRMGIRYIHRKGGVEVFDLELDCFYEFWSMMKSYKLDAGVTAQVMGQTLTIDKIVINKYWKDTYSLRLGGDYNVIPDRLRIRGGFFYESPAVREPYIYLDFLSLHRFGPSFGLTVSFFGADLSVAYAYVMQVPVVVTEDESRVYQQVPGSPCKAPYTDPMTCDAHYLGKPSAPVNAGTYIENYHFFNVGISYNFKSLF